MRLLGIPGIRLWTGVLTLALLGAGGCAGTATVQATHTEAHTQLNTRMESHCQSVNNDVTCTFTISNDKTSNAPFVWQAQSDPPGATFDVTSGSIAPGSSTTVNAHADLGCDVWFGFFDQEHQAKETDEWKSGAC